MKTKNILGLNVLSQPFSNRIFKVKAKAYSLPPDNFLSFFYTLLLRNCHAHSGYFEHPEIGPRR